MQIKPAILITGASGQLGMEFRKLESAFPQYQFLFVSKDELPIDDGIAINQYFAKQPVHYCVNCAAYTAVDKAESEPEKAMLINGTAVGELATVCKENNSLFIHISTDYVFDGNGTAPYKEDHPVNPVNTYGASKLKGEELAILNNPASIIIRTSWVYSFYGNNFVKTMLRLMKERDSINVVNDQLGRPTYAADLAVAIMQIIEQAAPAPGIYHFSNTGTSISWFDFALAVKELSGSNCMVNPVPSTSYPTPAKRPAYSVLDLTKTVSTFQLTIPHWKESLAKCIQLLSQP